MSEQLKEVIRGLINEAFVEDSRFSLQILNGLRALSQKFAESPEYFESVCEKDERGRCVAFPAPLINVPGLGNVTFLLWYSATDRRADDNMMYFHKHETGEIAEFDRNYEFNIGHIDFPTRKFDSGDPDVLNRWLAVNLKDQLKRPAVIEQIFHEVGHLQNLRKQTTQASAKFWEKRAPGRYENMTEPYAVVMAKVSRLFAKYEGDPGLFLKYFPTPESVGEYIYREFSDEVIVPHMPLRSEKHAMKIGAKIWADLSKK